MGFIIRKLCFDSHRFVKLSVSNVPKCQSTYKLQSPDPLLEKNVYKTNFPHSSGWQLVHVYKVPEVGIKIPSHIMYSNHLTMGVEIVIGWCWWRRYLDDINWPVCGYFWRATYILPWETHSKFCAHLEEEEGVVLLKVHFCCHAAWFVRPV